MYDFFFNSQKQKVRNRSYTNIPIGKIFKALSEQGQDKDNYIRGFSQFGDQKKRTERIKVKT